MKVIYICYQPLTEKIRDDFYILEANNKGFEIEYWDLSNIYFPEILKNKLNDHYITQFNNISDLEIELSKQNFNESLFIILITYESRVINLFRLLTKYKCRTAFFARGALPINYGNNRSMFHKVKKIFDPNILKAFIKNKYASLLKKKGFIKPYDLVFSAGEYGIQTIGYGSEVEKLQSNIININSFDFDKFIISQKSTGIREKKYCVFLDEYLPYHPDFKLLGLSTLESNEYFNILNSFLDDIEKLFNIEVIISAHPKAERYKIENPFNGRMILFNKTAELTKFAEFTIAHCSTSISFAVLNSKPIFLLYSNKMKLIMPNSYNLISNFSELLGARLINMDSYTPTDLTINDVDQVKYDDYKYKYLTSKESEGHLSSEIFIKTISKL